VTSEVNGQSIVLGRPLRGDRVPGIQIAGKGKTAIVVDPGGSAVALESELVRQLKKEGRPILALDVFQTGTAKAPRPGDAAVGPLPKPGADADEEELADIAAGYGKFLTFNVSVDAARVQDIVTAIVFAGKHDGGVELSASGDAALWAMFAAAISPMPISLHVEKVPALDSDADYIKHFNIPGILRAGGMTTAQSLANAR
jgi:hypothetical protein